MKKQSVIKSVASKTNVAEPALIEAIIKWKKDDNMLSQKETGYVPEGFKTFNQSSAFTKLSGNTEIAFVTDRKKGVQYINVPFTAWFLVSCIKETENDYKIGWAVSLS